MEGADSGKNKDTGGRSDGIPHDDLEGLREPSLSGKRLPSRKAITVLGSVAIAALVLSAVWMLSGISRPQVTILAVIPLSGASSYLVEIEDAMSMTIDKLNKWGGINGMHLRLVVVDCESDPEIVAEKIAEAEEKYHPLAIVTAVRGAATLLSEIAEEKNVVMISVGATSENLAEGKEWVFRYYPAPSNEAENALEILESLDVNSLGVLYLDDAYGNPVMSQLTGALGAVGVTVESYGFAPNRTDFSEAAASVADNDAVFAVALRHHYQAIFLELNSIGYAGYVLGALEASIPETWSLPEAQGCYVSAPIMYGSGTYVDTNFMEEFEERYGRALTHQGAIGSDVLKLIWSLLSDKEVSGENLRSQLSMGFVHSGILGVVILDEGAHDADIQVFPAVIEGGELRYL